MPALTRRRNQDRHRESWRIFYGDIEVGWIGLRSGVPKDVEHGAGTAGSFRSHIAVSAPMVLRRPSRRRAPISKPHGLTSCPAAAMPTSTNTASSGRTSRGNIRCGTPAAGCRRRPRSAAADVSAVSRSRQRASAITYARARWSHDLSAGRSLGVRATPRSAVHQTPRLQLRRCRDALPEVQPADARGAAAATERI